MDIIATRTMANMTAQLQSLPATIQTVGDVTLIRILVIYIVILMDMIRVS